MSEKLWRDEEIEQLLKQLPPVNDTRSKESVLARLKEAGAFNDAEPIVASNNKPISRAPIYIVAVAVALLAVVPTVILNNHSLRDSITIEESSNDMSIEQASSAEMMTMQDEASSRTLTTFSLQDRFAVYAEELNGHQAVNVVKQLPDGQIPMTLLVLNETSTEEAVQDFATYTLSDTQFQLIKELDLEVAPSAINAAYGLLYDEGLRYFALVNQSFSSVEAALLGMNDVKQPIVSAIAEGVSYRVRTDNELVYLQFDQPFDFDTLSVVDAMYMIEAINLTAASFQKRVQLENVVQQQWQGFDFAQPLPEIIGPNKIYLE